MSRDRTICMMRVRNESRWIRRSLERTFAIAKTVIIFDDGSTDATYTEAISAVGVGSSASNTDPVEVHQNTDGSRVLHYIFSPFRSQQVVRAFEEVNETRDKNMLWSYAKAKIDFDYVLCLDGDEVLSLEAIDKFSQAWQALEGDAEIVNVPFVYLWDDETKRRADAIYGDGPDGQPVIRHGRMFTVKRMSPEILYDTYFAWDGSAGSFHCGSIPQTRIERNSRLRGGFGRNSVFVPLPVAHYGYLDNDLRQNKFEFYNRVDPNNTFEGGYKHIIGQPNQHAPGPVVLQEWKDESVKAKIRVNVGCGARPIVGFINTDAIAHAGADRVCPAWELGLENESVIELQCHHVIEHFFPKDWPPTLQEFWRVLEPGGQILISCPDFGEVARGYTEGRYSIDDARTLVTATVPPFNSCDYNVPESYHRTVHSEASLKADLTAKGFVEVTSWHEMYAWNLFVKARKPPAETTVKTNGVAKLNSEPAFAVVLPSLTSFIHGAALQEAAEGVNFGLQGLGYDSVITHSVQVAGRQSIVFGPQLLLHLAERPVAGSVMYNLEQSDAPIAQAMLPLLKDYEVWDYSERNVEFWRSHGIRARHVPIGYVPELSRIQKSTEQDIDILFYGCLNDRRIKILDDLRSAGFRVEVLESVYGASRDAFIARSKVVLNMHFYEPGIFEIARCSYLLMNEVCVVSEVGIGDEAFKQAVCSVPYSELVSACTIMVHSEEARQTQAKRGLEIMKTFDEKIILKEALTAG